MSIEEKLKVLEKESRVKAIRQAIGLIEDLENDLTNLTEKNIVKKARIILTNKIEMKEINDLKNEADQLHQQNVADLARLKQQVQNSKNRAKRPRTKIEVVDGLVVRSTKK